MQIQPTLPPLPAAAHTPTSSAQEPEQGSAPFGEVLSKEIAERRGSNGSTAEGKKESLPVRGKQVAKAETPEDASAAKLSPEAIVSGLVLNLADNDPLPPRGELAMTESPEEADTAESNVAAVEKFAEVSPTLVAVPAIVGDISQTARRPQLEAATETRPANTDARGLELTASRPAEELAVPVPARPQAPIDVPIVVEPKGEPSVNRAGLELGYQPTRRDQEVLAGSPAERYTGTAAASDSSVKIVASNLEKALSTAATHPVHEQSHSELEVSATQSPNLGQAIVEVSSRLPLQAAEKLLPWVGTPAWENALGHKISWMITDQHQTASLTLNPPDLGPLQVVLTVDNGQATAAFFASEPEVRRAVEHAIPRLREMMDAAGIQLGDATVSAGTSGEENSFSGATHPRPQQTSEAKDQGAGSAAPAVTIRAAGRGLVDTFA
jgi:flagellar hook-length control protein FliK